MATKKYRKRCRKAEKLFLTQRIGSQPFVNRGTLETFLRHTLEINKVFSAIVDFSRHRGCLPLTWGSVREPSFMKSSNKVNKFSMNP